MSCIRARSTRLPRPFPRVLGSSSAGKGSALTLAAPDMEIPTSCRPSTLEPLALATATLLVPEVQRTPCLTHNSPIQASPLRQTWSNPASLAAAAAAAESVAAAAWRTRPTTLDDPLQRSPCPAVLPATGSSTHRQAQGALGRHRPPRSRVLVPRVPTSIARRSMVSMGISAVTGRGAHRMSLPWPILLAREGAASSLGGQSNICIFTCTALQTQVTNSLPLQRMQEKAVEEICRNGK